MELAMKGWDETRTPHLEGSEVTAVTTLPNRMRVEICHAEAIEAMKKGTAVHVMLATLPAAEAEGPDRTKPWWRP